MNDRHSTQRRLPRCSVMCVMLAIFASAVIGTVSPLEFQAHGQEVAKQNHLSANVRVLRGRLLLGDHTPLILEESDQVGLPRFDAVSDGERLRLAIREFRAALQRRSELDGYSVSQVHAFLARALRLLGTESRRQAEKERQKSQALRNEAQKSFEESFQHYRSAIKSDSGDLRYSFAMDLVQAIIFSGDLNRALMVITEFERERLKPAKGDHGLLRQKADIYALLGRYEEAGLTYEEWIRRGNVAVYLIPGDAFYEKLRSLKRKTGHPNNLPS